jgi:ketosteroid isomerase-like protein
MSQENIEALRQGLDAFNRGDLEAWIGYIHPDVIFEPIRSQIEGAYRGHAGIRRFFEDTRESFESFRLNVTDIRDLGHERVLAIGTLHLRAPGSGIETDLPIAAIATSRGGLLIHWKDYGDRAKALEAAGLRE